MLQLEAVDIKHLEAIGALGGILVLVGVSVWIVFGNFHRLGSFVGGEGVCAADSSVVLPGESREVHRAVVDGLLWQAATATSDGKRGDVAVVIVAAPRVVVVAIALRK